MTVSKLFLDVLLPGLWDTLFMVLIATFLAVIIGFVPAIVLVITDEKGLKPNKAINRVLDFIINLLRSFPFIILMIAIFPLTKLIVGTTIGRAAAIVPLTIAAAPFAARVIESSLKEIDPGIVEAAKSFGASTSQIIFKIMIKEALPSIVLGITLTVISVISYSAMAGTIGAGGLGDIAVRYGYQRFKTDIMIYTVIILIIVVQILQGLGNFAYRKLSK
jgi:D-methionine transport system permease protein